MAVQRFLNLINGRIQQVLATVTSSGASNAGQIVALDSNGFLNPSVLPAGLGVDSLAVPATEALAAGALVNVYSATGTPSARNADGSVSGKEAAGYVLAAVSQGQTATVFFTGQITGLTGLTAGTPMFLSDTTPGAITATVTSTSGHVVQQVGVAVTATSVEFRPQPSVLLA